MATLGSVLRMFVWGPVWQMIQEDVARVNAKVNKDVNLYLHRNGPDLITPFWLFILAWCGMVLFLWLLSRLRFVGVVKGMVDVIILNTTYTLVALLCLLYY